MAFTVVDAAHHRRRRMNGSRGITVRGDAGGSGHKSQTGSTHRDRGD
ncbi:hypothetical protein [Lysobacter sp. 1R34A]